jgi:hypothetical protein
VAYPRIACATVVICFSVLVGGIAVGSSGRETLDEPLNPTPIVAPRVATAQPEAVRADAVTRADPRSTGKPTVPCTPPPSLEPHTGDMIAFTTYRCP